MSRSYTNKSGERIEVDTLHLDTAIDIKVELQKASPSRRTSWAKHKKMMELEGFYDSENSENYRGMIKLEQKSRGDLPTVESHADMVAESKLEAIRQEIGEISLAKRDAQNNFRELGRLKRELSDGVLLTETIAEVLRDKDMAPFNVEYNPVYVEGLVKHKMIAVVTDVHYGAIVDLEGHYYDVEIAEFLMMEYADKLIDIASEYNVSSIRVAGLGDLIEHNAMRIQNLHGSERTLSEQIVEVSDLIVRFLTKLSAHVNVEYSMIGGNHDRLKGNIKDSIFGETAVELSNAIVNQAIRRIDSERIKFIKSEPYHTIIEAYGKNFLFVHGDRTPIKKPSVLAEQSLLYGIDFDAVFSGHVHHYTVKEVGEDKYVVSFGSIKGSDDYTLKTLNTSARRSQGVILIDEYGEFEIKQVKL